jgi:hypothetical protein
MEGETRLTLSGRFEPGAPDWAYLPVEVPEGVREISVAYRYDRPAPTPGTQGNALDLGVFDSTGFRGWSGGARDGFSISTQRATPGYLPGPVQPGTWHILLGPYTVAPEGLQWTVEVTLRSGPPDPAQNGPAYTARPAPPRAAGRGTAWYRGDLHLHTVHSDGERTPAEAAAEASAAGLDFLVSTDHNTASASGEWGAHAGADLLVLDGEEVTTRNGHCLALGLPAGAWIDWRYRAADRTFGGNVAQIHALGALAVAAHPFAPCLGCAWKFGYDGLDAVEVWNGEWTLDDEATVAAWDGRLALAAGGGTWLPAVGGSDAHSRAQPIGRPHTVVYATDLDRDSILRGVRAGRVWIAESAGVGLSFAASGTGRRAGIGERLAVAPDAPIEVSLAVQGGPAAAVRFVTDQGERFVAPLPAGGTGTVRWSTTAQNSRYVRAEVRRPQPTATTRDTMVALTNPIFLGG